MENQTAKKVSLKKAVEMGIVEEISPVRQNTNNYKYVTCLRGKGASNVYFGKNSSEKVHTGENLSAEQMSALEFVLTENEAGKERIKASIPGESSYVNLGSLFNTKPNDTEAEVLVALNATITIAEEVTSDAGDIGGE